MKLTAKQYKVADALREIRPPVIPGTNVIASAKHREEWNTLVVAAMDWNGVTTPSETKEFCDRAGVPD